MRRILLALFLSLAASAAHATCPATLELQDANGVKAAAKYTDDGLGNCQPNIAAQDGADVTQGSKADANWTTGAGSVVAILKSTATTLTNTNTTLSSILTAIQAPPALGTTGGWTPLTKIALTTAPIAVKTAPGQLGFLQCDNANTSFAYVQIYNLTTGAVSVGSTAPTQILPIPANLSNGFSIPLVGMEYSVAISAAAVSTTANGSTALVNGLNCTFGYN